MAPASPPSRDTPMPNSASDWCHTRTQRRRIVYRTELKKLKNSGREVVSARRIRGARGKQLLRQIALCRPRGQAYPPKPPHRPPRKAMSRALGGSSVQTRKPSRSHEVAPGRRRAGTRRCPIQPRCHTRNCDRVPPELKKLPQRSTQLRHQRPPPEGASVLRSCAIIGPRWPPQRCARQ